ncbi:MAG: glycogen debranching protein GlgX [Nitrososphaerota archaeon]|nr:glycogen debranching protein GlgX [Nitrososphaerota archaeon]
MWPGKPYPLGATWDGRGVNFALFSENATGVELLLYDPKDHSTPRERIQFEERTGYVWHAYLPDLLPGQLYAYSVDGPHEPERGLRFNKNKALIDPYAKSIAGTVQWNDSMFGYSVGDQKADLSLDERESGPFIPKCVVIDTAYDWEGDSLLRIPWNETIIYEAHVKGMTNSNSEVPDGKRGSYSGLASSQMIRYLKDLGITAIELLPIHHHVDNKRLVESGLKNYWGYNTIGFFAPDSRYSSSGVMGQQVTEFKDMVKTLHKAGIEVILDVVYNHTAEGNHLGPTLSFRGIDNTSYYRLVPDNQRYYMDFTGTGNSLNMRHPRVLQMIMDSLRYWVQEMHVDGFRFDLASTLARELFEVDHLSSFFEVIQQDPVISQVKLIAEPWDLGAGGYQVGNFPTLWAEWNGKYRDAIRRFWRGDEGQVPEMAYRLTGSSDLYQDNARSPHASINFVTCHDGFTLLDLVSHNQKHNELNQEDNRDGTDDNLSWNCGVEGTTMDAKVVELRQRQMRNFMATLFLSQGVPMILGGDEIMRTQRGNNNAYCQDNETSWFNWNLSDDAKFMLEFTRKLIHFRKAHPVLRRKRFFQGKKLFGQLKDVTWLQPNGSEMTESAWYQSKIHTIGMILSGDAMYEFNEQGQRIADDTLLVLLNASPSFVPFTVPRVGEKWEVLIDTFAGEASQGKQVKGGSAFLLESRTVVIMRRMP